jgi:D-alanyl-D-alanine carboxypeptidase
MLAAGILFCGTLTGCQRGESNPDTETKQTVASEDDYTYHIDIGKYWNAIHASGSGYLVLVNKSVTVSASYAPSSLTTLDASYTLYGKEVQMESTAALAAEAMLLEMWACGWTDILITSGYRSYQYQSTLFNTYLAKEQKAHPDWSTAQCEQEVLTYSAKPGTSEHHTGLCMDLIVNDGTPVLDESFAEHPAYAWLQENAYRFGFILRYPEDKDSVTGYQYEPWHYRFVGVEAATAIHAGDMTLEEYLSGTGG